MALSTEYILSSLSNLYGEEVVAADVRAWCAMNATTYQTVTKKLDEYKVGRGKWNLTVTKETVKELEVSYSAPAAIPAVEQNLIPQKDDTFVPFGNFTDIKKIIKSNLFYPMFITGLSGNGKTFCIEQSLCKQLNKELIRVNITIETDEDDLIGGFRLVNGETVWHNGPVIEALQRGAVLLLDEIDLASNKILCLQSILEGKGLFLRRLVTISVLLKDSKSLPLLTPRVRVLMMDALLAPMFLMKHSLSVSQLLLNSPIPLLPLSRRFLRVLHLTLMWLLLPSVSTWLTGQTSFARPSMMVALKM